MRRIIIALAALLFVAPALAGPNEEALIKTDRAFSAMAKSKGPAAAYAAFAAPDARMFDDGEGVVTGMDKIQKILEAEYAEGGTVSWTPKEAQASDDGTMGFTIGDWVYVTDGSPDQTGWYVTIWRKQKDGSWKFSVDADTTEVNEQDAQ